MTVVSRTAAELDALVGEIEAAGGRGARLRRRPARAPPSARAPWPPPSSASAACRSWSTTPGIGVFANVADTTDEDWDAVLATNLTAVFRLTRAALPHLDAAAAATSS